MMLAPDPGDDGDVRPDHLRVARHLARRGDADFEDGMTLLRSNTEDRGRDKSTVVYPWLARLAQGSQDGPSGRCLAECPRHGEMRVRRASVRR